MSANENHQEVQDRLFAFLDSDLGGPAAREVEQHVAICADCATELELCRRANELFSSLSAPALSDGFYQRLYAKLPPQPREGDVDPELPADLFGPPLGSAGVAMSTAPTVRALRARPTVTKRPWVRLLAAACLLLAVGLAWLFRPIPVNAPSEALLAYAGDVLLQREGAGAPAPVHRSVALHVGEILQTQGANAVVAVGASGSLRLAPRSRVRLLAMARSNGVARVQVELQQGAVWIDESAGTRVAVRTPDALLDPVGTVYEARLGADGTQVQVWDGRVRMAPEVPRAPATELAAGVGASVSRQTGRVALARVDYRAASQDPWVQWNRKLQAVPRPQPRSRLTLPDVKALPEPPPPAFSKTPPALPTAAPAAPRALPASPAVRASQPATRPQQTRRDLHAYTPRPVPGARPRSTTAAPGRSQPRVIYATPPGRRLPPPSHPGAHGIGGGIPRPHPPASHQPGGQQPRPHHAAVQPARPSERPARPTGPGGQPPPTPPPVRPGGTENPVRRRLQPGGKGTPGTEQGNPQRWNRTPGSGQRNPQRWNRTPGSGQRNPQRWNRTPGSGQRNPQRWNRAPGNRWRSQEQPGNQWRNRPRWNRQQGSGWRGSQRWNRQASGGWRNRGTMGNDGQRRLGGSGQRGRRRRF